MAAELNPEMFRLARDSRGLSGLSFYRKRASGHRAKRAGKSWEEVIALSQRDDRGRVVVLTQVPSGCRWIGPGRQVPVKSPFDFCGCVCSTGRAICFDAKSLGESYASFPLDNPKVVEAHQIAALVEMGEAGAISGLLVRCGRCGDIRWLDWRHLSMRVRVQWSDPRWLLLGPNRGIVPFRRLIQVYDLHARAWAFGCPVSGRGADDNSKPPTSLRSFAVTSRHSF